MKKTWNRLFGILMFVAIIFILTVGILPMKAVAGESKPELVKLPDGVETVEYWLWSDGGDGEKSENRLVAFDGNTVYLQGLSKYFPDAYVKGTFDPDKKRILIPSGQFVGSEGMNSVFLNAVSVNGDEIEWESNIEFSLDESSGEISFLGEYCLEASSPYGTEYWSYFATAIYCPGGKPLPVTPPDNLETEEWRFKGVSVSDTDKTIETSLIVWVGFDGEDLYIKGINPDDTNMWIKATKNKDGKYVVPANQYMGEYEYLYWFWNYYYFFGALNGEEITDAILSYNPDSNIITNNQILVINSGLKKYDPYYAFKDVVITKVIEKAAVPADPKVVKIKFSDTITYSYADFSIPVEDVDGTPVLSGKLYYKVFYRKNGKTNELTLDSSRYENIDDDMSEIPYAFDDNWDIDFGGNRVFLNQDDVADWDAVGVQSIYKGGGEINVSNIAWLFVKPATATAAPAANTLTYNGSDQALVTAGEAENGKMQYAVSEDNTTAPTTGWSENIPTGKNAGEYYVWYKVVGTDPLNVSDAACIKATISPKSVTITAGDARKVYDGNPLTKSDFSATILEAGDTHEFTVSMTKESILTDAGTQANVIATVDGVEVTTGTEKRVGNYLVTTVNGTLEVTKKAVTITAKDKDFEYNGTAQSEPGYDVEGLVGDDAITAVVTGSITFPGESPAVNKVDSYEFTKGKPENYSVTATDGELTMAKADAAITITAASGEWTYDGAAHTNSAVSVTSGKLFEGDELVASATGSVTGVSDTKEGNNPIADGYKIMHGTEDVTANYVITTVAGTLSIKPTAVATPKEEQKPVQKQKLVGNGSEQGLSENGKEQELITAPASLPDGCKAIEYSTDGGKTWSEKIPTGIEPGTYTIQVRYVGDENHATIEGEPITVTIKAVYTIIWLNGDGKELDKKTYVEGTEEPTTEKTPTKTDADNNYTFVKWDNGKVNGKTKMYQPVFSSIPKELYKSLLGTVDWQDGSGKSAEFQIKRAVDDMMCHELFTGEVYVDGNLARRGIDFTDRTGSTFITFKPEFLKTLSAGNHIIKVVFKDGETSVVLKILEAVATPTPAVDATPVTDDTANPFLFVALILMSMTGAAVIMERRRHSTGI